MASRFAVGRQKGGVWAGNLAGFSGLRFQRASFPTFTSVAYNVASVLPTAGLVATILNGGFMPYPQSALLQFIADATVITRTITVRIVGLDHFGGQVNEVLTITATASATVNAFTTKAVAKLQRVEVLTATNVQAADRITVGILVDALTRYALPLEIKEISDIVSGARYTAAAPHTPVATDFNSATIDLRNQTIRNIAGVATTQRVEMCVQSGWHSAK